MSDTTTTAAALLTERFQPYFVDEVSRYSALLSLTDAMGNLVFARPNVIAPSTIRWAVHTTASTPEVYVESQPTTPATNQGWGEAALTPTWFRVLSEYTGHLAAQIGAGELLFDALAVGEDMIAQDLASTINYSFLNASYNGLQVAIDETTTYAGISRAASPAYWSSYEVAVGGAQTLAALEDATEVMEGHTHQGKLGALLAAGNQLTNYSRLGGVAAAANNSVRINLDGKGQDLGVDLNTISWRGAPWRQMDGMTTTVILGIDTRPGNWNFLIHQPYLVQYQGRSADADQFHHKIACAIQCKRPKRHMKATGVTA